MSLGREDARAPSAPLEPSPHRSPSLGSLGLGVMNPENALEGMLAAARIAVIDGLMQQGAAIFFSPNPRRSTVVVGGAASAC